MSVPFQNHSSAASVELPVSTPAGSGFLRSRSCILLLILSLFLTQPSLYSQTSWELERVKALADVCYDIDDIGARLSSGSFKRDGMIIAPCSMKTLSALANSYTDNLITRAADTVLKERKRLVLLIRETPLHLGHLRNTVELTEMGAVIFPPIPAFYHKPRTIQDLIDHSIGKVLDLFDIEHQLFERWSGLHKDNG